MDSHDESVPGSMLFDALFQSFCLGFVLAQGFRYWTEYRDDPRWKQFFIYSIVLLAL